MSKRLAVVDVLEPNALIRDWRVNPPAPARIFPPSVAETLMASVLVDPKVRVFAVHQAIDYARERCPKLFKEESD